MRDRDYNMILKAYKEGADVGLRDWFKGTHHENPYPEGTEEHASWNRGYADGQGAKKDQPRQVEKNKE